MLPAPGHERDASRAGRRHASQRTRSASLRRPRLSSSGVPRGDDAARLRGTRRASQTRPLRPGRSWRGGWCASAGRASPRSAPRARAARPGRRRSWARRGGGGRGRGGGRGPFRAGGASRRRASRSDRSARSASPNVRRSCAARAATWRAGDAEEAGGEARVSRARSSAGRGRSPGRPCRCAAASAAPGVSPKTVSAPGGSAAAWRRAMAMKVLLPLPLGPSRPKTDPAGTDIECEAIEGDAFAIAAADVRGVDGMDRRSSHVMIFTRRRPPREGAGNRLRCGQTAGRTGPSR